MAEPVGAALEAPRAFCHQHNMQRYNVRVCFASLLARHCFPDMMLLKSSSVHGQNKTKQKDLSLFVSPAHVVNMYIFAVSFILSFYVLWYYLGEFLKSGFGINRRPIIFVVCRDRKSVV